MTEEEAKEMLRKQNVDESQVRDIMEKLGTRNAGALAPAPVAHQLVARVPGRGLDSAGGFRTAPGKNVMINAFRAQPLADLGRFGSGFGTQTVVNA